MSLKKKKLWKSKKKGYDKSGDKPEGFDGLLQEKKVDCVNNLENNFAVKWKNILPSEIQHKLNKMVIF